MTEDPLQIVDIVQLVDGVEVLAALGNSLRRSSKVEWRLTVAGVGEVLLSDPALYSFQQATNACFRQRFQFLPGPPLTRQQWQALVFEAMRKKYPPPPTPWDIQAGEG